MLSERIEAMRRMDDEISKREERIKRAEREFEGKSGKEFVLQGEFDRMRNARVEDALLIENLRGEL